MGLIGWKKRNRTTETQTQRTQRQSAAVTAYQNDFRSMAPVQPATDDRAGKTDEIQVSGAEVDNSRFYGASAHRMTQMGMLSNDVREKTGSSNVMKQTVDNLNGRVGITGACFQQICLGAMRKMVLDAIEKNAPASDNEEAREWGKWLSEGSRLYALLMPEMNSEVCRRDMHLDKNAKESVSDAEDVETTEAEDNVERIDRENKRIFVGDRKRMDSLSNWINSGQTREIDGEQYEIYWTQESYGSDRQRDVGADDYHSWTPEMKAIHEEALQQENYDKATVEYDKLEEATKRKYFWSGSKKTAQKAKAFRKSVVDKTNAWVSRTIQNRFFRLTSLMGLDFFKSRGNTVQFARDIGQQNYAGGRVGRVITDSEWAHANRMGYAGAGGHVHRVNGADRFKLRL